MEIKISSKQFIFPSTFRSLYCHITYSAVFVACLRTNPHSCSPVIVWLSLYGLLHAKVTYKLVELGGRLYYLEESDRQRRIILSKNRMNHTVFYDWNKQYHRIQTKCQKCDIGFSIFKCIKDYHINFQF